MKTENVASNLSTVKSKIKKISASKNNPIYNSHIYWSQKAFNITDVIIQMMSDDGDTIFDPFMGSGVSIIQSVMDGAKRNAIGCDINDVPIFIVDTVLKRRSINDTVELIKEYVNEAHELCDSLYVTKIDKTKKDGMITSVIFDIDNDRYICKEIKGYNSSTKAKFSRTATRTDNIEIKKMGKINNIADYKLLENSKLAVKKGESISHIFTPRNYTVIDKLIGLSKKKKYKDIYDLLRYILLSMLHLCKITDTHSNSQWPLWIPRENCVEKNVLCILDRRSKLVIDAVKYVNKNYKNCTRVMDVQKFKGNSNYLLLKKGIQKVSEKDIPNNSIDLIITDPPYMGQVAYSEYMQLYQPFLGFKINFDDEIVVSSAPDRNKDIENYFNLLNDAFEVCSLKLKNGKYMAMYFHDSNLSVWKELITILEKNKFRYLTQVHINKTNTLKNIISPKKSLNGDSLLFFVKDSLSSIEISCPEKIDEIELNVVTEAKHMIICHGGYMTTPEFYDNGLMELIIHNGWLTKLSSRYTSLVDVFEKYFNWDEKRNSWYIAKS